LLSAEFGVPYILEYNGSEMEIRRIFDGTGCAYEAEYREAEALAFEQATVISVVSAELRAGLVARGVDPAKILVNPNGVDLDAYAPAAPEQREEIRRGLGFDPSDRVIGSLERLAAGTASRHYATRSPPCVSSRLRRSFC